MAANPAAQKRAQDKKRLEIVTAYLDKKIMVVDPSSAVRSTIMRVLTELGAKTSNILSIPTFQQAMDEMAAHSPRIIITDYNIGENCGLDFLAPLQELYPDEGERLFILVTGNAEQSAVADAAEGAVDFYILKPFTKATVTEYLTEAILAKQRPSAYKQKIREGKALVDSKNYDAAILALEECLDITEKPTMAYYYLGKASEGLGELDGAISSYQKGLQLNPKHHKCLTGLFDALMGQRRLKEAYSVLKNLVKSFPPTPRRLGEMFQLAIVTENFEDIPGFYDRFTHLARRPPDLIKIASVSMVVCGTYLLKTKKYDEALEQYRRGLLSAVNDFRLVREVVSTLSKHDRIEDARQILKKFVPSDTEAMESKILDVAIDSYSIEPGEYLSKAKVLVREGANDPLVFEVLIKGLLAMGKEELANDMLHEATKSFPDSKAKFEKYFEKD